MNSEEETRCPASIFQRLDSMQRSQPTTTEDVLKLQGREWRLIDVAAYDKLKAEVLK